jgi:hypothetical protein
VIEAHPLGCERIERGCLEEGDLTGEPEMVGAVIVAEDHEQVG